MTGAPRSDAQSSANTPSPAAKSESWRFTPRQTAVRLFLTCWIIFALHYATNIPREIFPALSLGDHLSFDCSEYLGLHVDVFEMPGRGAFIAGNPGASMFGALPYALFRPVIDRVVDEVLKRRAASGVTEPPEYESPWQPAREFHVRSFERGYDVKFALGAGVMQAFGMAPLSALSAVVMYFVLLRLADSSRKAVMLALLYAFATPVFYRTAQLNHNLIVAHCALFAFVLLWRPWDPADDPKRPKYFWAGLLCGWTVICDYSGLVVVAVLGLYALARRRALPERSRRPRDILEFVAGNAVCAVVLMAYQWSSFGNPLWPAQIYMPPPAHGYRSLVWPQLELFWRTAFDPRFGLFVSAPLLLLVFHLPGWLKRPGLLLESRERSLAVLFTLAFLAFCSSIEYGYLQFNTGVRYIVPAVPFLFLLVANVLLRLPPPAATIVGIVGTFWSWSLAMYREVELGLGVIEAPVHILLERFRLPWMMTLERMGYIPAGSSPIPLFVLCGAIIWALWRSGATAGKHGAP